MRHLKKVKTLDRKKSPREALFKNLAASIIIYEKIKTTEAKAKIIRPKVEKLITLSKNNKSDLERKLQGYLPVKKAVKKLQEVLGERYKTRNGGYTRIIKLKPRQGDGAKMVLIELV